MKRKEKKRKKLNSNLFVGLRIIDHIFISIGLSINPGFSTFNGQSKGVHDNDGVAVGFALHKAHDLDGPTGSRVDDHLEEGECGDLHALEVVRVIDPGLLLLELGLRPFVVEENRVRC